MTDHGVDFLNERSPTGKGILMEAAPSSLSTSLSCVEFTVRHAQVDFAPASESGDELSEVREEGTSTRHMREEGSITHSVF